MDVQRVKQAQELRADAPSQDLNCLLSHCLQVLVPVFPAKSDQWARSMVRGQDPLPLQLTALGMHKQKDFHKFKANLAVRSRLVLEVHGFPYLQV